MGRRRNPRRYTLVFADDLDCVGGDRVYDPESEPEPSLMERLQCPVADEVLVALRRAFSLTFPRNPFLDGLRPAIADIRRAAADALKPIPEVLADLGLPPVPPHAGDPAVRKTVVFRLVLARTADIDIAVTAAGKRRRLLDLIEHRDATPLLAALRAVVTDTFAEAHDEDQHAAVLLRIRGRIWDVLPAFNPFLEAIEVEPVAVPGDAPERGEPPATAERGG